MFKSLIRGACTLAKRAVKWVRTKVGNILKVMRGGTEALKAFVSPKVRLLLEAIDLMLVEIDRWLMAAEVELAEIITRLEGPQAYAAAEPEAETSVELEPDLNF